MKQIPLTRGYVALVDDADYEALVQHKWSVVGDLGHLYAVRTVKHKSIYMHVVIAGTEKVDHRDGDSLNNQRCNLRSATQQQNVWNSRSRFGTSGYKGVSWATYAQRWRAQIKRDYSSIHIGYYATQEAAARAYDEKARELFGEFARLNFPEACT